MRIVISGATGFIGRALCENLSGDHEVVALSRGPDKARKLLGDAVEVQRWDGSSQADWADSADAIINMAGENIASGRWTAARKNRILKSRTDSAEAILRSVAASGRKPEVVVLGSAIGYYGSRADETLDEDSGPGTGFLARVCAAVEQYRRQFEKLGVRCVILRTGVVLGPGGGALEKMAMPFKFHVGGHIGSGKQWISWVSLRDEVRAIRLAVENKTLRGAYNVTAPTPVRAKEFFARLGSALRRRSWTAMPASIARLIFGEMADEMLLAGQKVLPKRLSDAGFEFADNDLDATLGEIYKERKTT